MMRIELAQTASLGLLGRAPGLIPEWRVGAIVQATALRDAATGQLWLTIGQNRVPARVASGDPSGPAHGEQLQLKVLRNSPVLAFESLDAAATTETDAAAEALRRVLPRQSSPAALLANIGWLQEGKENARALPQRVADSVARLWQGLPFASQLADADGLAAGITRSGVFLESQLAKGLPGALVKVLADQDLKALLLGLKATLAAQGGRGGLENPAAEAPAPLPMLRGSLLPLSGSATSLSASSTPIAALNTLAQETDGALARLTATQLINNAAAGLAWLIEIPVRHDNDARMLRFRFEREHTRETDEPAGWTVEAALELGQGEAVHARVSLRAQRISVQLRSDSPMVVSQLKIRTSALTSALQAAGLNVDQVVCLHGMPVGDPGKSRSQLVDLRA